MSEFLITKYGSKVWYDYKSDTIDRKNRIMCNIELEDGDKFFIRLHRQNGPAAISANGYEFYFIHGNCHRDDGPAIFCENEYIKWYLNDIEYSFEEWCEILNKSPEEINFLKLKWNIS